jgi:hypothetical protein
MGNIRDIVLETPILWACSIRDEHNCVEGWATPKAKHHAWLAFQICFGRLTVWTSMVGQIVGFARFASKLQNQRIIFLSIVISPLEFGNLSKIGLVLKGSFQEIGEY